ncbi:MAG: DUF6305 family protein [Tissierellia bacterium]|nr:DUF6305 family protein [Tissierellia bacterium]MDD4725949.1 DUF6305 family protein [Tissierellia bacterium]
MIRFKKNTLFSIITILLVLSLVGCGSSEPANTGGTESTEAVENGQIQVLTEAFAEHPTLLTSVGQSADVEMVKALLENAGLEYTMDKLVEAENIGDAKTLILAVGGSSKGLGAAGIDENQELNRALAVVDAAKTNDVKIIAMHIGGESRRGELSDKFIEPVCSQADYLIVVEDGNNDGLFTGIASSNSIPMDTVTSIADAMNPLVNAFK